MLRRLAFLLTVSALLLGSCSPGGAIATPRQPTATASPSPAPPTPSATPAEPTSLTLWVSPFFAPDVETEAGLLLAERLHSFEEAHAGLVMDVRVKSERGVGGLLDSLVTARAAAPDSLPDLIMLDTDALQSAAAQGILAPLEDLLASPESPDWYEYAAPASAYEGSLIALPVAAFSDVLAYRTDLYSSPPRTWDKLLEVPRTFLFPAADPRARFTLAEYLASGTQLRDSNGNPVLDAATLSEILDFYSQAVESGVIPASALQYARSEETWDDFLGNRSASAVAPLIRFLAEFDPSRMAAIALPTKDGQGITLATTWSWAIVDKDSARTALAGELADWLSAPAFLGQWTYALRVLPTRSEVLANWPDGSEAALASSLVTAAVPLPDEDLRTRLGLLVNNAVKAVLEDGVAPTIAAQAAIEALQSP
ncbi:MAG: extracellular solute-binding protein [Anaerolineales bacterium]|jgi:ABC-type glycerol-3-phosphate transport system substrate-binding protein